MRRPTLVGLFIGIDGLAKHENLNYDRCITIHSTAKEAYKAIYALLKEYCEFVRVPKLKAWERGL